MTDLTTPPGQIEAPRRESVPQIAGRIALPLGVVALTYGLWFVNDRLLYIGPLDRATFGWAVVVPLWLATPAVAGWIRRGLDRAGRLAAASAFGLVVGVAAALLLLVALQPNCVYGRPAGRPSL